MSPAGDMYPRAPATYTHHSAAPSSDRHYVLTSSISSTSITQHRLAMSQQHQRQQSPVNRSESSSHLDSASRTSLASSPSAGHSTATSSHANSADVSPATTTSSSSRTAVGGGGGGVGGDQFKLDVMPKEKTPRTPQRIPPPILTQWKSDDATRDCPPLSFQSNSSQSVSTASAGSKMSPSTPRSTLIHSLIGRPILDPSHPMHAFDKPYLPAHTAQTPLFLTESPVGYNETSHSYREDHDMEHCSEQDDVRAREHGEDYDDDDDDEEDEDENQRVTKRAHLDSSVRRVEGDDGEDGEEDVRPLTTSSPKTSVANSPQRDLLKPVKKATRKAPSPRRAIRPSSAQATTTDDSSEHMEDGGNGPEGSGTHSLHGKGLGFYAPLLCERVQAKGTTTLNELIHELAGGQPGDTAEMSTQDQSGQGNIRRRVYDALNILVSLGIISMDKRAIRWIGIQNSYIIREATKRVGLQELLPTDSAEGDRADESEEPEDDDMDIEQLQKEVDALRLQNQMEKAKIEDQIARHVQVNNLIRRNKLTEEKETERLERRRVRKLEKKAERRAQETKEGSQIPGDSQIRSLEDEAGRIRSDKKSHRHHRHRSPRAQSQLEEENDDSDVADMPRETRRTLDDGTSMEVDSSDHPQPSEDEARRLRKAQRQERRERRERKEKRAQRRQERESAARIEHDRIGLPCIVIRMPGYGAQSSDSEGCISVVRRVREEPRPRKSSHGSKSKHLGGEAEEEIDMMTTVEVKVSQQEELSVISDTEILSELRLHDLQQQQQQQQQQGMLPPSNHTKSVARHATATIEELEKAAAAAMLGTSEALAATASDVSQVQIPSVPGFERQMLQDHI
ncbi:Transcription factor Dp-2 [Gryganskiella cystojenkinii]|nr:Transcription factor Dp-2 [Gryganskiella cystojenkinii]